jgi:hypothetical protein
LPPLFSCWPLPGGPRPSAPPLLWGGGTSMMGRAAAGRASGVGRRAIKVGACRIGCCLWSSPPCTRLARPARPVTLCFRRAGPVRTWAGDSGGMLLRKTIACAPGCRCARGGSGADIAGNGRRVGAGLCVCCHCCTDAAVARYSAAAPVGLVSPRVAACVSHAVVPPRVRDHFSCRAEFYCKSLPYRPHSAKALRGTLHAACTHAARWTISRGPCAWKARVHRNN